MRAYHFTEMPYPYVPQEVEESLGTSRITVPNAYCDPKQVADLYNRYLDEYEYADELGLDLMLNEHHQTLTCLEAAMPINAAALARRTRNARIVLLGSPLPHRDNPLRVAEEIAMLDCLSRGRIVSGFVRGVPTEVLPSNSNPAQNRARFEEAHDLIIKAWTEREPFHWEGRFFHFRYANVWPRTYQEPHPPIWITGSSVENVPWVADHQYTFATFLTPYDWTDLLVNTYRQRCQEMGLPEPGPEKFAYLALVHVADTDEQAQEQGRQLMWYLQRTRHKWFNNPPGYLPPQTVARTFLSGARKPYNDTFESLQEKGVVVVGSPDTVRKKIEYLHERCGIGHMLMMGQSGHMPTHQVRRHLELFAREVYPAIRHLGEAKASPGAPEKELSAAAV